MSKRNNRTPIYKRKNNITSSKKITLPKNENFLISYDKGQFIISNKDGIPYDLGPQSMTRSYRGENKQRIIAQATSLDFVTDHVGSWTENFDFVFAMDTNTHPQKCDDFFCSAAAIYYGDIQKVNEYERNMTCRPFMIIDWYHSWQMKIEPVTWMEAIKKLQEIIPSDKKVGIVIDSELGNLEGYNNRTIPIFGQWFLPDNYTFMYATADANDEWCNKMIKQCDKTATQRLKEIIASPKLKHNPSGSNAPMGFITYFDTKLISEQ